MAFRRYVIWIAFFVIAVAAAFTLYQVADLGEKSAARVAEEQTNESIVQEVDLWQFVNKAVEDDTAGFNESVEVRNSTDAVLERGTDYEWNSTEGTIKYLNTANVTDGATGSINYTYFRNTKEVTLISNIVDPVVTFVGSAGLWAGGLALVGIFLAFAAFVARTFGGNDFQSNR